MPHASDSEPQRLAELAILGVVGSQLETVLTKRRIALPGGTQVEVDGANDELTVFVEAFAHVGPMKGGQKRKVALDVLKFITLQRTHTDAHLVLAFCDETAAASLTGWLNEALSTFSVDRRCVSLEPALRQSVVEAQARQYR